MIKTCINNLTNSITFNANLLSSVSIHSTSSLEKWFTNKSRKRFDPTPLVKYPYAFDYENKLGLDKIDDQHLPEYKEVLEALPKDVEVPKPISDQFTFRFRRASEKRAYLIKQILDKFGLHRASSDLSAKIIRSTINLRNLKQLLCTTDRRNIKMQVSTHSKALTRRRIFQEYRAMNIERFDALCKELQIDFRHTTHGTWQYETEGPRADAINASYQQRLQKLRDFQTDLERQKNAFYRKKHEELQQIRSELEAIGLNIETVFQEVLEERKEQLMQPIYEEKYGWYAKELYLREFYAKKKADKEQMRQNQARR